MEKIVSDDANIGDELNRPKPEDVAEDPVGTPEELGLSESVTEEEQTVQESIKDVSVATDDKTPEPPYVSIAQELADATVDTNGVEPPVEAPKEPAISETVAEEEVKGVDESSEVSGADSRDAKDENLEGQNSNLVELSRDIKMVGLGAESNVPSDDKQCESQELETEVKPNKQTLLDTFENENTEDKEQETVQVGARSLTETKADEEIPKAELSGKKPKTIISKVKQSIVKVKKALIGKSPSSKTMAPEGIHETKAN